ncbi:MAG: potassium transporter TrkG [Lachnospiraceae bacterium]|nr:potassium transporter TrkG [Lachnospiraceae bacterium]
MTSAQIIIFGFIGLILIGTLLLMLPFAKAGEGCATWEEALFTATSASCVTGLILQDTATYWSGFGQAVILCLIQIGGMGVVTMGILIMVFTGKKVGLMQRSTMSDAISAHGVGGIIRLTRFAVFTTLIIEGIGALLLAPAFCLDFGFKGIWYGVFHSISAFCNAGFDLMGVREKFSSLCSYASNPYVVPILCLLIIIGGLSFMTWSDFKANRWHFKRYSLQTKLILTTTGLLLAIPFLIYFIDLKELPLGTRFLAALFQAVTPRTAGFNTVDLRMLSEPSQFLMIILMLTGGAPGSTAGGLKVTTLAVVILTMLSVFGRRSDANAFGRRLEDETIKNAAAILTMYLTLFAATGCLISAVEHLPLLDCLFETASALGTAGLTLGITQSLSRFSHLILIALMYIGRVGGLTLIYAATSDSRVSSRLTKEKVSVG